MPRGGLPPAPTSSVGLVRESNMDEEEDPVNGKKREPRMMNAAQNLVRKPMPITLFRLSLPLLTFSIFFFLLGLSKTWFSRC